MISLMKKDYFVHNWITYSSLAIGLIALYIINIPPIFLFTIFFLSFLITLFYYDDKSNVNRFLVSQPVSKKKVVQSRYLFLAGLAMAILLFQWMVTFYVPQVIPMSADYVYGWQDIIILYAIALVVIAVGGVLFYGIRSFLLAAGIFILLYLTCTILLLDPLVQILGMTDFIYFNDLDQGFVLLTEKYIPFQPYLVLIVAAVAFFYISMKLSAWIFTSRQL